MSDILYVLFLLTAVPSFFIVLFVVCKMVADLGGIVLMGVFSVEPLDPESPSEWIRWNGGRFLVGIVSFAALGLALRTCGILYGY